MRHTVYWANVAAETGGVDLFVNDLPVARMGATPKISRPLNEYLRRSGNRVALRMGHGAHPATADAAAMGPMRVRIDAVEFLDADEIGRATLFEAEATPPPAPIGTPLLEGGFDAAALRGGLSALDGFAPVGPPERAAVMARLAEVAGWWRAGDAARLLDFLGDYVREFVGSYALETEDFYRENFASMVADMADPSTQVRYSPEATVLEPCGDGRLLDCRRSDRRAAITVHSPEVQEYDFNLIVGVRGGTVVACR